MNVVEIPGRVRTWFSEFSHPLRRELRSLRAARTNRWLAALAHDHQIATHAFTDDPLDQAIRDLSDDPLR